MSVSSAAYSAHGSTSSWVLGASAAPLRLQARIAPGQALYSTYASRMRNGTSTLMQPILRTSRDADVGGSRGARQHSHVYYGEDGEEEEEDDDDDDDDVDDEEEEDDDEYNDAESEDEEYGVGARKAKRLRHDSAHGTPSRAAESPADPEAEAELMLPGQQLGVPVPCHRLVVRRAKRTPHTYFSEQQLVQQGEHGEVLVPIRIEFHTETHRIKDVFLWNLHEQLVSPYQFAHIFLQDLELPTQPYAEQIESLIIQQLSDAMSVLDHQGDGHERLVHLKTAARERERKKLEAEAEQRRRAAMAASDGTPMPRKRGRPRKYPVPEPPEPHAETPAPLSAPPVAPTPALTPSDEVHASDALAKIDAEDDLRVIVEYEVQLARYMLRDRLEWDLCSTWTPELFAHSLVRDLGLPLESGMLISHALREQLLHHRRAAMELGLFGSGKMYKCAMDELVQIDQAEQESDDAHAAPMHVPGLDADELALAARDDAAPPHTRRRRLATYASEASAAGITSLPFLVPDTTLPLPVRRQQALATLRDLLAMGPRPLEGAWRDYTETQDFGPLLEYLTEADMDKMEEADMRATRRSRRDAQRVGRVRR